MPPRRVQPHPRGEHAWANPLVPLGTRAKARPTRLGSSRSKLRPRMVAKAIVDREKMGSFGRLWPIALTMIFAQLSSMRITRKCAQIIDVVLLLLVLPATAHAYVDPGSGSLLVQLIASGIFGGSLLARRTLGGLLRRFLRRETKSDTAASHSEGQQSE